MLILFQTCFLRYLFTLHSYLLPHLFSSENKKARSTVKTVPRTNVGSRYHRGLRLPRGNLLYKSFDFVRYREHRRGLPRMLGSQPSPPAPENLHHPFPLSTAQKRLLLFVIATIIIDYPAPIVKPSGKIFSRFLVKPAPNLSAKSNLTNIFPEAERKTKLTFL